MASRYDEMPVAVSDGIEAFRTGWTLHPVNTIGRAQDIAILTHYYELAIAIGDRAKRILRARRARDPFHAVC